MQRLQPKANYTLVIAAEQGNVDIVAELLCMDEELVNYSLNHSYQDRVRAYIARRDGTGPLPKLAKGRKWGLLQSAVKDKQVDKGLLAHQKADANLGRTAHGDTPLIMAAWNGHRDCVQLLLASGADVNARSDAGYTALYWATMVDKGIAPLPTTLSHSGDKNIPQSGSNMTPHEVGKDRHDIIHLLIDAGADENILHNYPHSHPRRSTDMLPAPPWVKLREVFHDMKKKGVSLSPDHHGHELWRHLHETLKSIDDAFLKRLMSIFMQNGPL